MLTGYNWDTEEDESSEEEESEDDSGGAGYDIGIFSSDHKDGEGIDFGFNFLNVGDGSKSKSESPYIKFDSEFSGTEHRGNTIVIWPILREICKRIIAPAGRWFTRWANKDMDKQMDKLIRTGRQKYELQVRNLSKVRDLLKNQGKSSEEIARVLHELRRELGKKYKDLTPKDLLEKIYQRNIEKYGDKYGPSIEWLREKGKSWEEIIESAIKPGGQDIILPKIKI